MDGKSAAVDGFSIEARDGLKSTEFGGGLQTCSVRSPDGTLWFVSLKGLVGYNPKTVLQNEALPQIRIESLEINGRAATMRDGMEISPGARSVRFGYIGLSYDVPTATRYKYYLEGYDDSWVDGRNQREVTYTNLPPGTYVFHVTAASSNGKWNGDGRGFSFTILPHFWQTGFFKAAIYTLLLLLLYSVYRLRVWRMVKREEVLKLRVDEAIANIKVLHGLIPICANCKKVRDDSGYWTDVAKYITTHSDAMMSHSICPHCAEELYGPQMKRIREKKEGNSPEL